MGNLLSIISVVIPCYNHGHYLPYALESILAQTYPYWEAIIVDDGSTDNTREVAQRYIQQDIRIRYVYQMNRGLSGARNTGITEARGEFLAFLDADDEWEPEFLQTCVTALEKRPELAAVYTGWLLIDEVGHELMRKTLVLEGIGLRQYLWQGGCFPCHSALVRASIMQELSRFDETLTSVEDWDFWLRLTGRYLMAGLANPLARYRVYPGSMSTNAERMHRNRLAVLSKHFGPATGTFTEWAEEKRRAYAYAYRSSALGYLMQKDVQQAWTLFKQGVQIWPAVLGELDTFYELACWDQPRGLRGKADLLDLPRNTKLMFAWLEDLFGQGDLDLVKYRQRAYGLAHLAAAMLADQAGQWRLARKHIAKAIAIDPSIIQIRGVLRRALKLFAGRTLTQWLRSQIVSQGI